MADENETVSEKKRGPGRPKGSINSKSTALARKLAEDEENCPLAVMVRVMKELLAEAAAIDPSAVDDVTEDGKKKRKELTDEKRRLNLRAVDVAKDAAPYVHARLQTISIGGDDDAPPVQFQHIPLTKDELTAELLARGLPLPNLES